MKRNLSERGNIIVGMIVIGVAIMAYVWYASQPNPNGGETMLQAQIHAVETSFGFKSQEEKQKELNVTLED